MVAGMPAIQSSVQQSEPLGSDAFGDRNTHLFLRDRASEGFLSKSDSFSSVRMALLAFVLLPFDP